MSSVSPASELFSDSSDSATTDLAERQSELPVYLRQALNMLDLQPEVEIAKYRSYKAGKLNNTQTYEQLNPVIMASEEEEEDYEEIPPSEPFAVMEHAARAYSPNAITEPPGELVFKDAEPPAASLDLSMLPPGEISSARNEYAPASQELWRSLGKPTPPAAAKVPGWKMPVAIGSSLTALAAVTGMTYVNMHPLLLQQVPVVSQLTAPPVMPAIPPGQTLQGPDLAMGEFSDLNLGNLNSITIPGSAAPIAQTPVSPSSTTATTPVSPVTSVLSNPIVTPNTTVAPVTAQPTNGSRLADTLIRNLLPPNIQQMAGSDAQSQVVTPQAPVGTQVPVTTQPSTTVKPYVPQSPATPPKSSKKISDTTTGNAAQYQVMAKYINPIGFERIRAILPTATRTGDRIHLGSFSEKSAADTLVARLKEQGIPAWRKQG
jgi:hypothetical protein